MGNLCCCCCKQTETDLPTQQEESVIYTVYSSNISSEDTGNEINAARIAQIGAGQIQSGSFRIPSKKDKSDANDAVISLEQIADNEAKEKYAKGNTQDGQTPSFGKSTSERIYYEVTQQIGEVDTEPKDSDFSSLHISNLSYKVRNLIQNIIKAQKRGWNMAMNKKEFNLVKLHYNSAEFKNIERKFLYGNQRRVRVTNICRIENAYLLCSYFLKKEELLSRYGNVQEKIMFHGTSDDNIIGIAGENFDWRLCETSKFGEGVYFATNSYYASHYPQWADSSEKVMIVAYVLVSRPQTLLTNIDHDHVRVPQPGYDSARNKNGQVLVKYDDNEFYPAYVVWYENIE